MTAMRSSLRDGGLLLAFGLVSYVGGCTVVLDADRHVGEADPVAVSDFCAEVADVRCTGQRDCCTFADFDFEECVEGSVDDCASVLGPVGLDPRAGYDARLAGSALAEARELVAACDPAIHAWVNSRLGLARIFTGGVEPGEACEPNPLAFINRVMCVDDGACRPAIPGTPINLRCAAPTPQGGTCYADAECEPGLRCSVLVEGVLTGRCERLKESNAGCLRDAECATHRCVALTCRASTQDEAFCRE